MFFSPAFAQSSGGAGAGSGIEAILPLVLIFVVFYFLLIRPQQRKMKQHKETLASIRRSDKVVTGGGIIGVVTKVDDDDQLTIEIAKDVKVKVRRELISSVMSKIDAVGSSGTGMNNKPERGGGLLSGLFGGGAKDQKSEPEAEPDKKRGAGVKKGREKTKERKK